METTILNSQCSLPCSLLEESGSRFVSAYLPLSSVENEVDRFDEIGKIKKVEVLTCLPMWRIVAAAWHHCHSRSGRTHAGDTTTNLKNISPVKRYGTLFLDIHRLKLAPSKNRPS